MRQRAVAVVIRDGKVLLVRDKGKHSFSLPGGAIKKGELTVNAAARELDEELGLKAVMVKRLQEWDFRGAVNHNKVCLIQAAGEPHLKGHELDKYIWWDMKEEIPVRPHVSNILKRVKSRV